MTPLATGRVVGGEVQITDCRVEGLYVHQVGNMACFFVRCHYCGMSWKPNRSTYERAAADLRNLTHHCTK